jgi:predicted RNA binding protein YcfA (HicA-like mRNA interferase family)
MPRLPRITARQAEKVIRELGFELRRQSGSHKIFWNDDIGKRITLPCHGHKIIHPKIVRDIIRDSGVSSEEFFDLL